MFSTFKSPWFFLESPVDYQNLFERQGFLVTHCSTREENRALSPEQVYQNFQVGAENGYLDPENYSVNLSQEYVDEFRCIVREAFYTQAGSDGLVTLKFRRFYLVAEKIAV
ncbi:MAG: hypothetical protein M1318_07860 [Firmicutes bacterium]|nr:hypothetical protein [Bacillota bacterium]